MPPENPRTLVIAMGGPNGSGKSTLANNLISLYKQQSLSCFTLRSDEIRKNIYTQEQYALEPPNPLKTTYSAKIAALYLESLQSKINDYDVLLLDAAHTDTHYREKIEQICLNKNADFIGLKFVISKETCWQRLQARQDSIEFANAASLDAHFTNEIKIYTPAWVMIDGEQTADGVLQQARIALKERFPEHVL